MAPWWIPISFKSSSEIDTRWAPLDTCASKAPIYTLKASLSSHALLGRGTLLLGFAQRLLQAIGYVFGGCACAVVQRPWH